MAVMQASVNSYNGHVWLSTHQNLYVIPLGQATDDTEIAQPVVVLKVGTIGQVADTEIAQPVVLTMYRYVHSTFVFRPAIAQSLRIH